MGIRYNYYRIFVKVIVYGIVRLYYIGIRYNYYRIVQR